MLFLHDFAALTFSRIAGRAHNIRRVYFILAIAAVTISDPTETFAQSNAVGNIFGLIGAIAHSSEKSKAQRDWQELPPSMQFCMARAVANNGSSINQMIEQGAGPDDSSLFRQKILCQNLTSRELQAGIDCNIDVNGTPVPSKCNEVYAEVFGSETRAVSQEQYIQDGLNGGNVTIQQVEIDDAKQARLNQSASQLSEQNTHTRVEEPSNPTSANSVAPFDTPARQTSESPSTGQNAQFADIDTCDMYESSPLDFERVTTPVYDQQIKTAVAIPACLRAIDISDKPRFHFELGRAFLADEDYFRARNQFQIAAASKYPCAEYTLGVLYLSGLGVEKDKIAGEKWFDQALPLYQSRALAGDPAAEVAVGQAYFIGMGVDKNERLGINWLQKAADQNYPYAEILIAGDYHAGSGVVHDDKQAFYWLQKAASQNDSYAEFGLGYLYHVGSGVVQDDKQAFYWWQKAAYQSDPNGEENIGTAYHNGWGVTQDDNQAFAWWQRAAQLGNPVAETSVAAAYLRGWGVAKNNDLAFEEAQKSAGQGDANGEFLLGSLYLEGWGVSKNRKVGVEWLSKAAQQGQKDAQKFLHDILDQQQKSAHSQSTHDNEGIENPYKH